jgi:hypothetical protein
MNKCGKYLRVEEQEEKTTSLRHRWLANIVLNNLCRYSSSCIFHSFTKHAGIHMTIHVRRAMHVLGAVSEVSVRTE